VSITISQLASRYAKAAQDLGPNVDRALGMLAQVGVGLVKTQIHEYHAVKTGTMLNSTTAERESATSYLIGPTVQYAPYVALGTSRMKARPFHIKAATELKKQAGDVFKMNGLDL